MKVRALASLIVTALVFSGCGGGGGSKQSAAAGPPPLVVDVAKVTRQDISTHIALDGQIAPLQQASLGTPESGTISAVLVNEGDRVSKGQVLAKLDASQLVAQLAANRASVTQAQARLNGSAIQAPISSQGYISNAAAAEQNLASAQNRIATAEAALRNAELVNNSDQSLVAQGYVSQTSAEQARANYVSAEREVRNARAALPAAEAALRSAQSGTGQSQVDQATIASNRAALEQAQANVQLLETQISQSSIYAPFDGVVTARLLDPGAFAGPNEPIVQVSQIDEVYVNASVPDEDLAYVHEGTPATFTSASIPGKTFSGSIFAVNATPTTGTLSYRARIKMPNPGDVLRGGMLVSVSVQKESHPNALVVPRTALFESDAGSDLYTVVDGKAKMLPVTVGLQTDLLAEVRGNGVTEGTTIITTRPDALQDGSTVAIAGATPAPANQAH
jgi:RND family efflux transporter MFP subunit